MFDITDFSKTFYYPGGGTDIQPLLRFSHLADTIISPTVSPFLTRKKLTELFAAKCEAVNQLFAENLIELVDVIDMDHAFDNEPLHVKGAEDIFSRHEATAYQNAFADKIPARLSATKFVFKRTIGKSERIMHWIHATSEGLAMLFRLHELTGQVPEIVCTIQTGVLEYPNGLFIRMFDKIGDYPKLWIRGYWPAMDWDRTPITPFGPYHHIAQDYGHWFSSMGIKTKDGEDNPAEWWEYAISYVRGFSRSEMQPENSFKSMISAINPNRRVTLVQASILEHLHTHDHVIISEHVKNSNPGIDLHNITTWESLGNHHDRRFPPLTFYGALTAAEHRFSKNGAGTANIAMLPTGFEDEGQALQDFLESTDAPVDLTVYIQRPFDFIDVMHTC